MNCKKIQELILTDYVDGEMAEDKKILLDGHISECKKCREFLSLVKETTVAPLGNAKRDNLSEDVIWSKIREEIHSEEDLVYEEGPGFFERIRDMLFSPQPAFALGTFAVILLLVMTANFNRQQVQLVKNNQVQQVALIQNKSESTEDESFSQEEYLAYFFEENDSYEGYGTSLESYFL